MSGLQIGLLVVLFLIVFGIVLVLARLFAGNAVQMRLDTLDVQKIDTGKAGRMNQRWLGHLISLTRPLAKLSLPEDGWEESPIRIRFINAGWRKSSAPALFYAAKTGLTLLFPLLAYLLLRHGEHKLFLWLVLAAALG